MKRKGSTSRARPLTAASLAAFLLAAALVAASDSTAARGTALLPSAETVTPRGLSPQLRDVSGSRRVRITLRAQPLLKAAAKPEIRDLIEVGDPDQLKPVARANPEAIAAEEKRLALRGERRFERAVDRLAPANDRALKELEPIEDLITAAAGRVIESEILPVSIVASLPASALDGLAGRPEIQTISPAPRERPLLDFATPSTGATAWWAAGYTGGEGGNDTVSVDVGMRGDAVDQAHPAFSGVNVEVLSQPLDDHGMHVGGVIASQDPTYRGAAYGIDTLLGSGDTGRLLGFTTSGGAGTSDPAEVINKSAGSPAGADGADTNRDVEINAFDFSYAAAGGNENVDGSPTVNNIGRNQLVMAGYKDLDNTLPADDVILEISSRGPTPGGRKKPDLIAPAGPIQAPDIAWNSPPSNPDFTGMTGTSFASPFGASAMALLEGAAIGDSKAQRAILINSAGDWTGASTGITNGWSPGAQGSWQPEVGWGVLDLTQALADRGNFELADVDEGSARFFRANSTAGSKTTLAWELRGTWPNYPANGSQPLAFTTSNLDLRQYRADTLAEIAPPSAPGHGGGPDSVDSNDTVEQVRAPAGNLQMIYKVSSESTVEGLDAEPFAIAGTEALTPLVNPEVEPFGSTTTAAAAVNCSTDVQVTTTLRNQSPDFDAGSAEVTLQLPPGVDLIAGPQTQTVGGGNLAANGTSSPVTWTVRATSSGAKSLTVAGSGGVLGETFTKTEAVSLTADCAGPVVSIDSGPSGSTTDTTPSFAFSANESASFECAVDAVPFAPCASPYNSPPLANGPHTFAVRGTDGLGNLGSPTTRSFTVAPADPDPDPDQPPTGDQDPPSSTIISGPKGPTAEARPSFSFTADEPSSFTCRIDNGARVNCSSPYETAELEDGDHRIVVQATDSAGNVEVGGAIRYFTVDTTIFRARLKGKRSQRQRGRKVAVKVRVGGGEQLSVRISGKLQIPGRDARLAPKTKDVDAGQLTRVKVKPKRQRDARRAARALKAGKRVRARVTARYTDDLGISARKTTRIRLR